MFPILLTLSMGMLIRNRDRKVFVMLTNRLVMWSSVIGAINHGVVMGTYGVYGLKR